MTLMNQDVTAAMPFWKPESKVVWKGPVKRPAKYMSTIVHWFPMTHDLPEANSVFRPLSYSLSTLIASLNSSWKGAKQPKVALVIMVTFGFT